MNGNYADYRDRTGERRPVQSGRHRRDGHRTVSSGRSRTAADQVRLGMAAMQQPALAAITAMRTAVIPVAGVVHNYDTLLGQDGITGLKTGSTLAAGGCVLLAARRRAAGRPILVVAASFGQPGTMQTMLRAALKAGDQLVLALDRALHLPARHKPGSGPHKPKPKHKHKHKHKHKGVSPG